MARNDEGEFELILGNRQLLSVFFLVVLLLGLCFVGGYVLGRGAAPVLNATAVPPVKEEPAKNVVVATPPPAPKEEPASAPVQTAVQAPPEPVNPAPKQPEPVKAEPPKAKEQLKPKAEPAKAKTEPVKGKAEPLKAKADPPKPEPPKAAAKAVSGTATPIPGRVYLQLSATDKDKAEAMVDLLRGRSLPGMAAAVPERPGLFRVLVGPMAESGVADMRNKLKAAGFPAEQAIKRTF